MEVGNRTCHSRGSIQWRTEKLVKEEVEEGSGERKLFKKMLEF